MPVHDLQFESGGTGSLGQAIADVQRQQVFLPGMVETRTRGLDPVCQLPCPFFFRVICRADSHDIEANMASFGTDYIIDPFDTFADHLSTALNSPGLYLLYRWLTGVADSALTEPIYPPKDGHWIICGYGRLGKAIHQRLRQQGIRAVVVEAMPDTTGMPPEGCVIGRGTEADTLAETNKRLDHIVSLAKSLQNDTGGPIFLPGCHSFEVEEFREETYLRVKREPCNQGRVSSA